MVLRELYGGHALDSDSSGASSTAFAVRACSCGCVCTAFARSVFHRILANHLCNADIVDRMVQHVGQNLHDGLLLLRHYRDLNYIRGYSYVEGIGAVQRHVDLAPAVESERVLTRFGIRCYDVCRFSESNRLTRLSAYIANGSCEPCLRVDAVC